MPRQLPEQQQGGDCQWEQQEQAGEPAVLHRGRHGGQCVCQRTTGRAACVCPHSRVPLNPALEHLQRRAAQRRAPAKPAEGICEMCHHGKGKTRNRQRRMPWCQAQPTAHGGGQFCKAVVFRRCEISKGTRGELASCGREKAHVKSSRLTVWTGTSGRTLKSMTGVAADARSRAAPP